MIRLSAFALVTILFFTPGLSVSQETLSQVQREMARVEKEIKREKNLHKLEKKKAKEFESRKKQKLAALNKQLHDLEGKKGEIKGRVSGLKGQKYSYQNQIKSYVNKQKQVSEHLIKKIAELIAFFEKDFPHQKEKRTGQLKNLADELKDGTVGPEMGINRLFTLLQGSIDLGYEAEVYSGSYSAVDGKTYEGKYLRLGTVISAFVSLDGNKVGFQVIKNGGYTWIDDELSLELKQNIKSSVQIAQGKAAPELVLLPFLVPLESQGGTP